MTLKNKFLRTLSATLIGVGLYATGTAPIIGVGILGLTTLFWGYRAYCWLKALFQL